MKTIGVPSFPKADTVLFLLLQFNYTSNIILKNPFCVSQFQIYIYPIKNEQIGKLGQIKPIFRLPLT